LDIFKNITICCSSDIGTKRTSNEDNYLLIDGLKKEYDIPLRGMMFAIADGMGGHVGGFKASRMACQGLLDYYRGKMDVIKGVSYAEFRLNLLEKVILNTHKKIQKYAWKNEEYEGMGTTLSVIVLLEDVALLAHVGDSRIYRFRESSLEQLTEDHTMAQLSVEMGYLRPEDVSNSPLRHFLVQSVGAGLDEVQTRIEKTKSGDVFMLCSDGLHNMVSDDEIQNIILKHPDVNGICDLLVRAALDRGGRDNVTVIVVRM
jgi:protein phosphatase